MLENKASKKGHKTQSQTTIKVLEDYAWGLGFRFEFIPVVPIVNPTQTIWM